MPLCSLIEYMCALMHAHTNTRRLHEHKRTCDSSACIEQLNIPATLSKTQFCSFNTICWESDLLSFDWVMYFPTYFYCTEVKKAGKSCCIAQQKEMYMLSFDWIVYFLTYFYSSGSQQS